MLKITNAEVFKNSRILLGEDCHIRYAPKSPYQVIIGQNGIGKTTFLTNLLSYPSLGGKAFHKDGFARVNFELDNRSVETRISHDGKYSFTVDGLEENVGGTQAVQKDKYAEYFGITSEIEAILSPNFDFLAMTAQKRQEFLAKLTTGDLSVALNLFKKLEQKARQSDGAIKRMEANLIELKSKAIPAEDYEAYKQRLEALNSDIRDLLLEINDEAENRSYSDISVYTARVEQLEESMSKEWVRYYCFGGVNARDEEHAIEIREQLNNQIARCESELDGLMQQFQSFEEILNTLTLGNVSEIEQRESELHARLNALPDDSNLLDIKFDTEQDYRDAYRALESAITPLSLAISEIRGEWSERLLNINLENLRNECSDVQRKVYKLEAEIAQIDTDLDHQHSGEVRCPDCGKQFTPGLDERRRATQLARREQVVEAVSRGKVLLESKTQEGVAAKEFQDKYNAIRYMCSGTLLTPIFLAVNNLASLLKDPGHFLRVSQMALQTLSIKCEKSVITEDLNTLAKQKMVMKDRSIDSSQSLTDRMAIVEDRIWRAQRNLEELRSRRDNHVLRLRKVKEYDRWAEQKTNEYEQLGDEIFGAAEYHLNQIRRELLVTLQSSAAELSTLIANYEKDHTQLEYLEGLIESERELMVATRLAADELSPKTGMIAEQLFGFIESFFSDVMEICNTIWTYNVQIFPAKDTAENLTYTFPVEFNDSGNVSDDISKTSDGQYSLLNFAIKITALRYKGYSEGPVFLDEPEADFTPAHKVRMMNFIRDMVEAGLFTQVFIISHHESGWGALPYPDIVDFSYESNLPGTNEVVKFK